MPDLQQFLALIYTDAAARARFLGDPYAFARAAGFSEADARELAKMDAIGLQLAARSFERKRRLQ